MSREKHIEELLGWSLQTLTQLVDRYSPLSGSMAEAAELAERLARRLGMDRQETDRVKTATLLLFLDRIPNIRLPRPLLDDVYPGIGQILESYGERSADVEVPPEAQVAALALAASQGKRLSSTDELRQGFPGRFTEEMLQVYERLRIADRPSAGQVPAPDTQLITVGRTLERAGDFEGAATAYRAASIKESRSECVHGLLGLARLAVLEQNPEVAEEHLSEALSLTDGLSSEEAASVGLETGLLMRICDLPATAAHLRAAERLLNGLGRDQEAALCKMAILRQSGRSFTDEVLESLNNTDSLEAISPYLDYLMPDLLEAHDQNAPEALVRLLGKLAFQFPGRFLFWLEPTRAEPRRRVKLVENLERLGAELPHELLQRLLHDPNSHVKAAAERIESRPRLSPTPGRTRRETGGHQLRIYSLGSFEVAYKGEPMSMALWETERVKMLFAYLAQRWGQGFPESKIMADLFKQDGDNRANMQFSVTALRRLLRRLDLGVEEPLIRANDEIRLDPALARWHDLENLEKHLDASQTLSADGEVLLHLRKVPQLHVGPYLEGCQEPWALARRAEVEERVVGSMAQLVELCLRLEAHQEALEHALSAAEIQPTGEAANALVMHVWLLLKQPHEALAFYRELEHRLQKAGLQPGRRVAELYVDALMSAKS